jgi:hypothetical protein
VDKEKLIWQYEGLLSHETICLISPDTFRSTADQYLRTQEDALNNAGCEEVYTDVASGVKTARPGLHSRWREMIYQITLHLSEFYPFYTESFALN